MARDELMDVAKIPTFQDVVAAAERIKGEALCTPLLESEAINEALSARVLFKVECFQKTGSFKFRGALNRLSLLSPEERQRGVFAYSSGNHGNGVAAAARLLGISAVVAMPADTPKSKLEKVAAAGAEVVTYDRVHDDRDAIAQKYIDSGRIMVHPYDDPMVIAGQGTVGLEIASHCEASGLNPDIVLAPCGGGGLTSSLTMVFGEKFPDAKVYGVEPEGFDDTRRSLLCGHRVGNVAEAPSICDSIMTPMPGELSFKINQSSLAGIFAVPDSVTARAMAVAAQHLKTIVEPGGVVALAALLSGQIETKGQTIVCVLSGGNVDLETFSHLIQNQEASLT